MMTKVMHVDSGPIGRTLFSFALPVLLTQLLQELYSAADCAVLGHFGGIILFIGRYKRRSVLIYASYLLDRQGGAFDALHLFGVIERLNFPGQLAAVKSRNENAKSEDA